MKTQYKKIYNSRSGRGEDDFYYHIGWHYYRHVKTLGTMRQYAAEICDEELRDLGVYPRPKRSIQKLDDFMISRNYKKSWKDYTKHRKQWMMGEESKPIDPPWECYQRWVREQIDGDLV